MKAPDSSGKQIDNSLILLKIIHTSIHMSGFHDLCLRMNIDCWFHLFNATDFLNRIISFTSGNEYCENEYFANSFHSTTYFQCHRSILSSPYDSRSLLANIDNRDRLCGLPIDMVVYYWQCFVNSSLLNPLFRVNHLPAIIADQPFCVNIDCRVFHSG